MGTNSFRYLMQSVSLTCVVLLVSAFVDCVRGAIPVSPVYIILSVGNVTTHTATLKWHPSKLTRPVESCVVHYGEPLRPTRQVVTSSVEMRLDRLQSNVTYSAIVKCHDERNTFQSNSVQFVTFPQAEETTNVTHSSNFDTSQTRSEEPWQRNTLRFADTVRTNYLTSRKGDEEILVVMNQRHMSSPRRNPHSANASTNVILGAVCGVVGFLIINVTVVMAVRQYSLRRARRRRFFELQLEQHGGYLFNFDDLIEA